MKNLSLPFKIISSLIASFILILRFKPNIVVGTGGYASGAVLYVASLLRKSTLIHEQNAYPGVTNRLLSKRVSVICTSTPNMEAHFPSNKLYYTGNPVRTQLINYSNVQKETALRFFGLNDKKKVLLVLGGSLGAQRVNSLIANNLDMLTHEVQLIWQCGKNYFSKYKQYNNDSVKVTQYISKMAYAYQAADIILSRAGAGAIAELALVAKPTIFIPSPHVTANHQVKNAQAVAKESAAISLEEKQLDEQFLPTWNALIKDVEKQKVMSNNFKEMAKPKAAQLIVNRLKSLL